MTKIAVITGNPKPDSRTHSVAVAVSDLLAKETVESADRVVIDLAKYAPRLFDWSDPELTSLTAQIDQMRRGLEAVAAKVRRHEETIRRLERARRTAPQ